MSLIEIKNLKFKYTDIELYNDINFRVLANEHAFLVGPNGVGKTTLLKLLTKTTKPDSGTIEYVNNLKIGYLDQYLEVDKDTLVIDYLASAYHYLFETENKMLLLYDNLTNENDADEINKLLNWASDYQHILDENNFYQIKSNILGVLSGLGLNESIFNKNLGVLSGGMLAKVVLSKLLLGNYELLILDEPTNFLDAEHVKWLSDYLNEFPKAFFIVSHNEDFIRSCGKIIYALDNKEITRFKGNYDFYLTKKDELSGQLQKSYFAQQKFIKETKNLLIKILPELLRQKELKVEEKC